MLTFLEKKQKICSNPMELKEHFLSDQAKASQETLQYLYCMFVKI